MSIYNACCYWCPGNQSQLLGHTLFQPAAHRDTWRKNLGADSLEPFINKVTQSNPIPKRFIPALFQIRA